MKIGVFGGSFNPIHIGHCIVASHILQSSELDEVWLNVSPQNPLKEETSEGALTISTLSGSVLSGGRGNPGRG